MNQKRERPSRFSKYIDSIGPICNESLKGQHSLVNNIWVSIYIAWLCMEVLTFHWTELTRVFASIMAYNCFNFSLWCLALFLNVLYVTFSELISRGEECGTGPLSSIYSGFLKYGYRVDIGWKKISPINQHV